MQAVAVKDSPVLPPEYLATNAVAPTAPKSAPFNTTTVPPVVARDTMGVPKDWRLGGV